MNESSSTPLLVPYSYYSISTPRSRPLCLKLCPLCPNSVKHSPKVLTLLPKLPNRGVPVAVEFAPFAKLFPPPPFPPLLSL